MTNKKKLQLGMNPSTASYRLVKDTLWRLIQETNNSKCSKCNKEMSRETFSIEHIIPWLDSENPLVTFFDQKNITFSHLSCNVSDARRMTSSEHGSFNKYLKYKCRCDPCVNNWRNYKKEIYTPEDRRNRYLRTGN